MTGKRAAAAGVVALLVAVWLVARFGPVTGGLLLLAVAGLTVGVPVMRLRKRDRAELFRSLRELGRVGVQWSLSWTFTRPRNFLVSFVAVVTGLVVVLSFMHSTPRRRHTTTAPLVMLPTGQAPVVEAPATPTGTPVTVPMTAPVTQPVTPSVTPSVTQSVTPLPAPKDALVVAAGFLHAWSNHPAGITLAAWRASMRPYITPTLDAGFATSDPQNVPSTDCGDPRMGVTADGMIQVLAACPPAGNVTLTLVRAGPGWAVGDVE